MKHAMPETKLMDLVRDPAFVRLRQKAETDLLLWGDLDLAELPQGVSAEDTWLLITTLRHQLAPKLPTVSYLDVGYETEAWFTETRSCMRMLRHIEAHAKTGSDLDRTTRAYTGSPDLSSFIEREIATCMTQDGAEIEPSRIRNLYAGHSAASTTTEQIAANVLALLARADSLAERRVSPGFLEYLQVEIEDTHGSPRQGGNVEAKVDTANPHLSTNPLRAFPGSRYADPDECVHAICEIASDHYAGELHAVERIVMIYWLLRDWHPMGPWNETVSFVLREILLAKWNLPALQWVPLASLDHAWVMGQLEAPWNYADVLDSASRDCGVGLDVTGLLMGDVWLIQHGLDELEPVCGRLQQQATQLEKLFLADPGLNHRQQAIVVAALQSPQTPQLIEPHRQRFNVTYATARADFLNLVARGYMRKEAQGRAFVFFPANDLARRL